MQGIRTIRRLSLWVLNQIVQDVPKDSELCEFDCGKGQCTYGEWAVCERRLGHAQGELMPASEKVREPSRDFRMETPTEGSVVS